MQSVALQAVLSGRFAADFQIRQRTVEETLPTGIPAVDEMTGGFPRGCVTEITGPASSGRTSLLHAVLAAATSDGEVCALVDTEDAFDPVSAGESGVALDQLLWIRCRGNAEHALRAADLLIHGGGFGLVAMDLGDTPPRTARRISLTSWYRFRRAIEPTRTVMVVIGLEPYARQCASLSLETRREGADWPGMPACSRRLEDVRIRVDRRKPMGSAGASFVAGS